LEKKAVACNGRIPAGAAQTGSAAKAVNATAIKARCLFLEWIIANLNSNALL
jgi:hypothetical protein